MVVLLSMRKTAQLSVRCRYTWSALPIDTGATQSAYEYWTLSNSCEMVWAHGTHRSDIYYYCCWERLFRTKLGFLLSWHLYFWAIIRMCDCGQSSPSCEAKIFNIYIFSVNFPSVLCARPFHIPKFSTNFLLFVDKLSKSCDTVLNETRSEAVATASTKATRWPTIL